MHAKDTPCTDLRRSRSAPGASAGQGNVMPRQKEGGIADILRRNVMTLFNLLNLVLAGLLLWVGSHRDMLFLGVVLSNTLIGTVQELRAKRTHDRLQLLSERPVRVMRDGEECSLPPRSWSWTTWCSSPGGTRFPPTRRSSPGRPEADESLLTGESAPVSKAAGDALYSGSFLVSGSVAGAADGRGRGQLLPGGFSSPRADAPRQSELMRDMRRIIRWVSLIIVPLGAVMFLRQYTALSLSLEEAVTGTVASVLGMIPEGLILLTSVSLAAGVVALGRRNAAGQRALWHRDAGPHGRCVHGQDRHPDQRRDGSGADAASGWRVRRRHRCVHGRVAARFHGHHPDRPGARGSVLRHGGTGCVMFHSLLQRPQMVGGAV